MLTIYRSESSGHGPCIPPVSHSLPALVFTRKSYSSASAVWGPAARTWIRFSGHLPLYTDPEPASFTPVLSVVCVCVCVCKMRQNEHSMRLYFKIKLEEM